MKCSRNDCTDPATVCTRVYVMLPNGKRAELILGVKTCRVHVLPPNAFEQGDGEPNHIKVALTFAARAQKVDVAKIDWSTLNTEAIEMNDPLVLMMEKMRGH